MTQPGPVRYGVIVGLLATLAWSLNFIVPFVIGNYSVFDFALFRFLISGLLGLGFLIFKAKAVRRLRLRDWLMAFWLGLIGYLGYFYAVAAAAIYAGPVIAPAFLGLVPVVLAIAGNLRQHTVSWKELTLPLILAAAGLLLVNISTFSQSSALTEQSLFVGVPAALAAVALWTGFGLINQSALAKRPGADAGVWTALILAGAGLGMLSFLPIGLKLGVFEIPRLGLRWEIAAPLYIWGTTLAVLASIGGALAWTFAAQRVPIALSAQLITMETVFGTVLGLLIRRRWPTIAESVGMTVLIVGVVMGMRIFYGRKSIALQRRAASRATAAGSAPTFEEARVSD
jgi:drug/metabolite transporter (DMT)-like permease